MEWISNTYDPNLTGAFHRVIANKGETSLEAWNRKLEWLGDKTIGKPKKTDWRSVEQLERMGYVGVYIA